MARSSCVLYMCSTRDTKENRSRLLYHITKCTVSVFRSRDFVRHSAFIV